MTAKIEKDDIYFHPAHGPCRVSSISSGDSGKGLQYVLLPVTRNSANARFVIPESALVSSGFCKMISARIAKDVLEYFATGKHKGRGNPQTWRFAELVRNESMSDDIGKDGKRRQALDRALKGIVGELAGALQITVHESVERVRDHLSKTITLNSVVTNALARISQD